MSLVFNYNKDLPKVTLNKEIYLKEQVKILKNIHQPEQKSQEWYEMRNTMLTASDWGTVLGENHYSNSTEVLKKKCGIDKFVTNAAMAWGNKYEYVAVQIYEYRNNVSILEFGCIRHPFISFLGASPDGITTDGIMLEIKCPSTRKITGIPPRYYWCQVQGQLEVCELDRCDFLECSLKEYGGDDAEYEYYTDNFKGDKLLNKYGNEKGVIAEFYDSDHKFFYKYSPVGIMNEELEKWKQNIIKNTGNLQFSSFSYWYLEEVSCVPIYRDQEWFNTAKVDLEIFWNKVLKYRELGIDVLLEDLQDIKDEKKIIKEDIKVSKAKSKAGTKTVRTPKKESSKKQKKINDFIVLDNVPTVSSDSISDDLDTFDSIDDDFNFNSNVSMFIDDCEPVIEQKTVNKKKTERDTVNKKKIVYDTSYTAYSSNSTNTSMFID